MKNLDLFSLGTESDALDTAPLAERMRPRKLADYIGQPHLIGEGTLLKRAIAEDKLFSMIFWGPPGSGKTTLARILANETKSNFVSFSAVLSGVKEIRSVIDDAREIWETKKKKTILFVDEIHRFNKAQQDAFLPHVESGLDHPDRRDNGKPFIRSHRPPAFTNACTAAQAVCGRRFNGHS